LVCSARDVWGEGGEEDAVYALKKGRGRSRGRREARRERRLALKMSSRLLFEREKDATVGIGSEMGFCMLVGTRLVYMKNSFPQR
jgi:hypothetical protein